MRSIPIPAWCLMSLLVCGSVTFSTGRAEAQSVTAATEPAALLAAPAADTIAILRPNAEAETLVQEGEWVRVRLEGWVRREEASVFAPNRAPESIRLSAVRSDPEGYKGQAIRWRAQYVSLERADSLRSDMERGERYLLLRDPGGEPGFVYAVVPGDLLAEAEDLAPLQRVEIAGRVRVGRSPLTGHPIIDVTEINR